MTHTISASPFIVLLLIMRHLTLILFPYTTLFRSLSRGLPRLLQDGRRRLHRPGRLCLGDDARRRRDQRRGPPPVDRPDRRSEEHTSELQSPCNLVCRLLLEKKKYLTVKIKNSV